MGSAGFRERPLAALLPRGRLRGKPPQELHELSGVSEAREVSEFGHSDDSPGEWHATQGLEGFDPRVYAPRLHLCLAFLFATLETFGVCVHGPDIVLEDDVWRRGGPDDRRAPPEVGRSPGGPARLAEVVSEKQRCQAKFGGLQGTDDSFTSPTQVANGLICNRGNIDRGESPRAHQTGQVHGIAAALAASQLTRVWHRRSAYPPEVIMSRLLQPAKGDQP